MATVGATDSASQDRLYERRLILASSLGNAIEWFDFIIFGFLAATIAKLFFPTTDQNASILLTFATFGVTFLLRPLGAALIGSIADRQGRRAALVLAIGLMTLGSAIIGLAPTYEAIGIGAPLLVLLARCIQGLSAGGEFGTVTAFMAEQDPARRGYLASWPLASQGLATILATVCGMALFRALPPADLLAWGWRIPFLIGVAVGPVAIYIRGRLDETPVFRAMTPLPSPLRSLVTSGKADVALCAGLIAAPAAMMYVLLYLPTYAETQLGLQGPDVFLGGALAGALQLLIIPFVGRLSDRYGRVTFAAAGAAGMLVMGYPLFSWISLEATVLALVVAQAVVGLVTAVYLGAVGGLLAEAFPPESRGSGVAVGHAIGVTLFGGLAPFIFTLLITTTGDKLSPSLFVALAAAISLGSVTLMRRRQLQAEGAA